MMHWLLKHEGYPPSVVAAVLLHGVLLWLIFDRGIEPREMVEIAQPSIVATTVQQNPQRARLQEQREEQRKTQQQKDARERERQQERARAEEAKKQEVIQKENAEKEKVALQKRQQEQEQNRKQEEDRQRVAREKDQQAERERQQQAARDQAQKEAAESAQQQATSQQALSEEQQLVAKYSAIIKMLIEDQWNRPPSTRNGMYALLELKLVPTGEIIASRIVQSSGDAVFDRSIEQAVGRVGSFPELQDVPAEVFNRNMRTVTLGFKAEDLLR